MTKEQNGAILGKRHYNFQLPSLDTGTRHPPHSEFQDVSPFVLLTLLGVILLSPCQILMISFIRHSELRMLQNKIEKKMHDVVSV